MDAFNQRGIEQEIIDLDGFDEPKDIVLLFDRFDRGSSDLFDTFVNAGMKVDAAVINDDGFLPEGLTGVFDYFLGDFDNSENCPGHPLYFNQITVPDYWEISSNNNVGKILDKGRERGRIFYASPSHERFVKCVDYLDEDGTVRLTDHYNKYGALYARTTFNKNTEKVNKSFFNVVGQEIIVHNFVTGDIILNYEGQIFIFRSIKEFVCHFLKIRGWDNRRIFFNSLSIPFFVSNALGPQSEGKRDILFWQENARDDIPGNMQMIFDGVAPRCERVIIQNKRAFRKLLELGAPAEMMSEMGYIYSFKKRNMGRLHALICTNTEDVEKLKEIVEGVPEMTFHVAAITEMSSRLLAHEKYDNVIMYPNVRMSTLDRLFELCDYYLDINHANEIVDATRRAFVYNLLIISFKETQHGVYTADENIFDCTNYSVLIKRLRNLIKDKNALTEALNIQHLDALTINTNELVENCGL